jgi:hypothetical protein
MLDAMAGGIISLHDTNGIGSTAPMVMSWLAKPQMHARVGNGVQQAVEVGESAACITPSEGREK